MSITQLYIYLLQVFCQWLMLDQTQMDRSSLSVLPKLHGKLHVLC